MTLYRMLQRRGTASQWSTANTVLGVGEIGFAYDTNVIKIGDGTTAWNSLQSLDGKSAYELAVADGYSGTQAQWLASLVGPTGATGADSVVPGPTGDKGDKGDKGDIGLTGAAGADSVVPGPAGANGTFIEASTSAPTSAQGNNGDLWIVYS